MKGSSHATVITAIPKRQQTRLVRPSYKLRERDDGDTNVFMRGLFDHYAARPTGAPFDNMTLAHFAVWYNTASGGDDDQSENTSGRCLPRFQLQNRSSELPPGLLESPCESHGDNYYYHLLLLYLHWRQETG